MNKLKISLFAIFITIISSCNSELEEIKINEVKKHIAYQDKILNSGTGFNEKYSKLKWLISEYQNLKVEKSVSKSNYYYYLSRLYGKVNDFPLMGFWIDTINNRFLNVKDYVNYFDSSFYYAEKSLLHDADNIRSMFILSNMTLIERNNYFKDTLIIPDSKRVSDRMNYIVNNAKRFQDFDLSENRKLSRGINEVALEFLDWSLDDEDYKIDLSNLNIINQFYLYGQLWDYIKDYDSSVLIAFNKDKINTRVYPKIEYAREYFRKQEIAAKIKKLKNNYNDIKEKKYFAGTARYVEFGANNSIKLTFEYYYEGWKKSQIKGKFVLISDDEIQVLWANTNTISFYNIIGSSCDRGGLTKLIQNYDFTNTISFDDSHNCMKINFKFRQKFVEGTRCGDENKEDSDFIEFCID